MTEEEKQHELLKLWLIVQDNLERVFHLKGNQCLCNSIDYLTWDLTILTKEENKILKEEMHKEAEVRGLNKFKFFWPLGELKPRVEFVQKQIIKILKS